MGFVWRVLLIGLIVWLLYRLLVNWFKKPGAQAEKGRDALQEMVQDPACKVYLPRGQAIELKKDGREYYFCSEECKEKFLEEYKKEEYKK